MDGDDRPIGIFDSGLGGLSVLKEVRRQLPTEAVVYFADQGRLPYGPRPVEEIRQFAEQITRFLLERHAKVIAVACNTASAAALAHLRGVFPDTPFVGMEPAVKPAVEHTRNRVVGVIATQASCQSDEFASVVDRFAADVTVIPRACPELVTQVEAGEFASPRTMKLLHDDLDPLVEAGIDSLVLGCTHFAFLRPAIEAVVGPGIHVIDPSPAVARQVGRVIRPHTASPAVSTLMAFTTGTTDPSALASSMLGQAVSFRPVRVEGLQTLKFW
jgi:glutamate racemase